MPVPSAIKVGRIDGGYCVRVEGRGTMRESRAAHDFAVRCVEQDQCAIVADLSACEYLDSTFLGSLVDLHRKFGVKDPVRFQVVVTPERENKLFETAGLVGVFHILPAAPAVVGEMMTIAPAAMDSPDLPQHIMECHRLLSEFDSPNQAKFRGIAEQMSKEIQRKQAPRP